MYDDYKFVTRTELEELGLTQHIGSSLLRAYMHGYFMDIRLYNKVSGTLNPIRVCGKWPFHLEPCVLETVVSVFKGDKIQ